MKEREIKIRGFLFNLFLLLAIEALLKYLFQK